jgi:DNA polymerase III sliding clamp (beta) subunit (PCNA family)
MTTTIKREALTKIVNLVRPALSTLPYIPAFQHIRFDGDKATAYDDTSAISVLADIGLECCIPGEMLTKALGSFSGDEVLLQKEKEGTNVVMTSGRAARLKVPTLPVKDFPFQMPSLKGHVIEMTDELLAGIEKCRISVGTNPKHPAAMGVTLDEEDGHAVLFSTDSVTVSRFATKTKVKLPAGAPVILPTFFCDQLMALAKAFPKDDVDLIVLGTDGLAATFGKKAELYTKTLVDMTPLDFPSVIKRNCNIDRLKLEPIPDAFDAAFGRAMLVQASQMDKKATITAHLAGGFSLHAESASGVSDDDISFKGKVPAEFSVDPTYVIRASKACTHIAFEKEAVVMGSADGNFLHLIAHVA